MTSSPLSSPTGAVVKKASDLWSSEDAEDDLDASTGSIRKNVGRTRTVLFRSQTKIQPSASISDSNKNKNFRWGVQCIKAAGRISAVAVSSDGKLCAYGFMKILKVLDVHSCKVTMTVDLPGHVRSMRFSSDNQDILIGGEGFLQFVSVSDGKANHTFDAETIIPTPNAEIAVGDRVARDKQKGFIEKINDSGEICQVRLDHDSELMDILRKDFDDKIQIKRTGAILSCDCSRDNKYVCAGGGSAELILYDKHSSLPIREWHLGRHIRSCQFSYDSSKIICGGGDYGSNYGEIAVFEVETGKCLFQLKDLPEVVLCCEFAPDGNSFVYSCGSASFFSEKRTSGSMTLYSFSEKLVLRKWYYDQSVYCCTFSNDGKLLASSDGRMVTGMVKIWDIESGFLLRRIVNSAAIYSCCFTPRNDYIISGGFGMELKLSQVAVMNTTKSLDYTHDVTGCAFSHSSAMIAVCGNTQNVDLPGEMVLWDLKKGAQICKKKFDSTVHDIEFSSDDTYYVVVTKASIKLFSVESASDNDNTSLYSYSRDQTFCCSFSPKENILAVGKSILRLSSKEETLLCNEKQDAIYVCKFSANGSTLSMGGKNKVLYIYDIVSKEKKKTLSYDAPIDSCEYTPDGKIIFIGGHTSFINAYNIETGKILFQLELGDWVLCLSVSKDGNILASGGKNKALILWDISNVYSEQNDFKNLKPIIFRKYEHDTDVKCCCFANDRVSLCYGTSKSLDNKLRTFHISHYFVDPPPLELKLDEEPLLIHRPYLLHSQDRYGKTFLHRVVEEGTYEQLQWCLDQCNRITPISTFSETNHRTPLDIAIDMHQHAKSQLLLKRYLKDALPQHLGLSSLRHSMLKMARRFPDLLLFALENSVRRTPSLDLHSKRMRLQKVLFQPYSKPYSLRLWSKEKHESTVGLDLEVESHVVGFEYFLEHNGIFKHVTESKNMKAFETKAMIWAIHYKWEQYGRKIHTFRFLTYVVMTVCYVVGSLQVDREDSNLRLLQRHSMFFLGTALLVGFFSFLQELRQLCVSPTKYVRSFWNIAEFLVYLGVSLTFPLLWVYPSPHPVKHIVIGWTAIIATMNTLSYLRPYASTGPLVRMLEQIVVDIKEFALIQVITLVSFTVGFVIMVRNNESFKGVKGPLLIGFEMLLGDWDLKNFESSYENGMTASTDSALLAFTFYMIFVTVISMNLLIAIMGDAFDRVRENQRVEGRMEKARVLSEIEDNWLWLLRSRNKLLFPKYFHVLAPRLNDDQSNAFTMGKNMVNGSLDWEGRVRTILNSVNQNKANIMRLEEYVKANMEEIKEILRRQN